MPSKTFEKPPATSAESYDEKDSRLSPELQTFVRTTEFKEWFGDWENDSDNASKIVDENGEPKLVYFGGHAGIKELHGNSRNRTGDDELGFYFTAQYNTARFYAQTLRDIETDQPVASSVYGAFLNIRNPYTKQPGDGVRTERVTNIPDGHDGYINDMVQEIVVFSPDQVAFVQEDRIV